MRWLVCVLLMLLALPLGCRRQNKDATAPAPDFTPQEEEALWEEPKKEEEEKPAEPEAPPAPPKPTSPPPDGIAGFKFGQLKKDAQSACTLKGTWKRTKPNYTCSKPAEDPGLAGSPVISFCDDKVCAIGIAYTPDVPDFAAWDTAYTKMKDLLVQKHGEPTTNTDTVTDDCKNEKFVVCMESGTAEKEVSWQWDNHVVTLRMSKKKTGDGPPAIRFVSMPKAPAAEASAPAAAAAPTQ
jgi:hypothetical protein